MGGVNTSKTNLAEKLWSLRTINWAELSKYWVLSGVKITNKDKETIIVLTPIFCLTVQQMQIKLNFSPKQTSFLFCMF